MGIYFKELCLGIGYWDFIWESGIGIWRDGNFGLGLGIRIAIVDY